MILSLLLTLSLGQNTIRFKDEGVNLGSANTINCTGGGLTCTKSGLEVTFDASAGGGGYATIKDEGDARTQRTTVNFLGVLISCVDNAGTSVTDCTISAPSFAQVTGTATPAQLGTGSPDSSTFLRGDGVWATPPQASARSPVVGALPAPAAPRKPLTPMPNASALRLLPLCNPLRRTNCR